MGSVEQWLKAGLLAGSALSLAACSSYPTEPRYPIYPVNNGQPQVPYAQSAQAQQNAQQAAQQAAAQQGINNPYYQPNGTTQAQPPVVEQGPVAPSGAIDGGGLPPTAGPAYPSTSAPSTTHAIATPAPSATPVVAGAAYVIQPGDTISGVGRRFQTPVQTLIDLNALGPRGTINAGQRITLPSTAVDRGVDPYATGPAPTGTAVASAQDVAPTATPPRGNAPLPSATPARTPAPAQAQAPASSSSAAPTAAGQPLSLQWPVRGEVLRRFGPVGMGERNNGINIGASAGAEVKASADGTVAYVGDDIVGQGLTVLIVHRDGWRTVYSHLGSSTVRDGVRVRAGQAIGTVGLTAGDGRPSIHYEVRQMRGDDPVALDPLTLLPR